MPAQQGSGESHRSYDLLLLKVLSEDQQHGRLLGAGEQGSVSGPTPGPRSQNLSFQRNPRWFIITSLSFLSPIYIIGMIKPIWHNLFRFKQNNLHIEIWLKMFCSLLLPGAWLCVKFPSFRGGHQGPSGVDDLLLTCPSLRAPRGQGLCLFYLCFSSS